MSTTMTFFDHAIFRKSDDGRTIIYPWGIFGRAYTTSSEVVKDRLRSIYMISVIGVPVFAVLTSHISILVILAILPICLLVHIIALRRVLANAPDLQPIPKRDSSAMFVRKISYFGIVAGCLGCFVFVIGGLFLMTIDDLEMQASGLLATVAFSIFGVFYVWLFFVKRRIGS